MKKSLFFFALAIIFISCDIKRKDKIADDSLIKQEKQKKQLKENIEIALKDSTTVQLLDSVYDFGTVNEGALVQHSFRFKNTGTSPLVVQEAHATCGCTIPEKPEQPIKPGETGVIKVVFNTKGKRDHQEKVITVNSNARPEFGELKIVGTVKRAE